MMDKDHQADASKPVEAMPGDAPYTPMTALYGPSNRPPAVAPVAGTAPGPTTRRFETPAVPDSSEAPTQMLRRDPPRDRPLNTETGDPLFGTPYRTICRLGSGGMGEVFEAEDLEVPGNVVVKVLHEKINSDQFIDRMRLEAESLATLDHPNIVQVSRFSRTPSGLPYLAMERLYGRTLHEEILARGGMSFVEAIDCARQILSGLGAAHARGIVHRDIKPQNIFLCDGAAGHRTVKLLDFGLAKAVADSAQQKGPAPLAYPTGVAMFVGTVRYAAPEQIAGSGIDQRTDLYSFGLVFLMMLTGRPPYDGTRGQRDLIDAQLQRSAWKELPAGTRLPAKIVPVLEKLLVKRPQDRYASAAEVIGALDAMTGDQSAPSAEGSVVSSAQPSGAVYLDSSELKTAYSQLLPQEPSASIESSASTPIDRRKFGVSLLYAGAISAAWFAFFTGLVLWWLRK